ncbi:MAG: YraN family protein [Actinomycetota bacterium]|nr:YraN family protein [Actinomycetota bacterium]
MAGPARGHSGTWGEDAAAEWYRAAGFVLVDRNWRCPLGEVDLVMHRETTPTSSAVLAFVEVKARSSTRFGSPADALTPAKQRRVRRAAAVWLTTHTRAGGWGDLRFDLVSVTRQRSVPGMGTSAGTSNPPPLVDVIEHAF